MGKIRQGTGEQIVAKLRNERRPSKRRFEVHEVLFKVHDRDPTKYI